MAHRHLKVRYLTVPLLLLMALAVFTLAVSASPDASSAGAPVASVSAPNDGVEPLPPNVEIQTVLSGMTNPTAMVFDSQGRLFYTEKTTGNVRLFANGILQSAPVINFSVSSSGERGMLGITLDPNFDVNHYVYVYFTSPDASQCPGFNAQNRVVRFVENEGVGSNPTIIFTSCQSAGNHVGGNIHFAPDGKLYISVGDNASAGTSQNVSVTQGKMHRINPDGTIPNDNPVFTQTGALPSLYAMGLRNSFDFAYDPLTPPNGPYYRIFASENGPSCDDEMNRIEAGYNYGWRSGYICGDYSPTYNTIPALWYQPTGQCCIAPTGIAVYTGTQISEWTGHLFMAGYNNGSLRHFYLNGARTQVTTTNVVQMPTGTSVGMDIETGPDGAFWFIQGGGYSPGTLKRIVRTGPTATATTAPSNTPTATTAPSNTPIPPTNTAPPPTSTATRTSVSTFTPSVVPTITPGINTPTNTAVSTPTSTMAATNTPLPMPTQTPVPTNTTQPTSTVAATNTIIPIQTPAPTNTTAPPTATPTATAIPTCSVSFSDVPSGHTFYANVRCLACRGIISGYADGTFKPDNLITRGQLAKIVSNAAGFTESPGAQIFQDVPPDHAFYEWINRLTRRGHMTGYECGGQGEPCVQNRPYFRPFANATRAQTSKIVANAARFTGTPAGQTFQDVPPSHPFYEWIQNLADRSIMSGYQCGGQGEPCVNNRPYFRPYNDVTRGQSAKIVANTFYPGCGVTSTVVIENFASNPENVTVGAGTTVRWRNLDLDYHSVTSRSTPPLFDSDRIYQNGVYEVTFDEPGTYEYYCKFHIWHGGTVIVTGP